MTTRDQETQEEIRIRRFIGWHRAAADAQSSLAYAGAHTRVIAAEDLGRRLSDLFWEGLNRKRSQIEG